MLLYPLPALVTPFSGTFIIKNSANNERNPPSCSLPYLLTLFPVIIFINEEGKRCINEAAIVTTNEAAIGVIIVPRNRFRHTIN